MMSSQLNADLNEMLRALALFYHLLSLSAAGVFILYLIGYLVGLAGRSFDKRNLPFRKEHSMKRTFLLLALLLALTPLALAQKKPNLSGVWRRTLGREQLTIEHRKPNLHLIYWIKDLSGERTLDLTALTDGKEHRQTVLGQPATVTLRWGGAGLVWEIQRLTGSLKIHNRRTLRLAADGQTITAERVDFNADGSERARFTETWIKTAAPAVKSAAESKAEQELAKLANEFDEALRRSDTAFIEKHFAPNWLYTTLEGQTGKARAAILAGIKSGALKIEEWKSEDVQWQIYGDTALSSALVTFKGQNNGQAMNTRFRATSTFIKRNGVWQAVATQHTPITAAADKRKAEQEIEQFINELVAAFERNDAAALDRLYADDFTGISVTGEIYGKPGLLGAIKSGAYQYQAVKVDQLKIQVHGEAATVHSRGHLKLRINGQPKEDFTRDTTTLVKRQGQWRLVADHASTLAKQ
jgi:ketosteroid isomerase-like protein